MTTKVSSSINTNPVTEREKVSFARKALNKIQSAWRTFLDYWNSFILWFSSPTRNISSSREQDNTQYPDNIPSLIKKENTKSNKNPEDIPSPRKEASSAASMVDPFEKFFDILSNHMPDPICGKKISEEEI